MYIFARHNKLKIDELSPEMLQEKMVHDSKISTPELRQQNIEQDALSMALLISQSGNAPTKILEEDTYWIYVRERDPKYLRSVLKRINKPLQKMKNESRFPSPNAQYIPAAPTPKQQPQQGPAMGSSNKVIKTAGKGVFLKRTLGPYRLMGSFVGNILCGRQQFLGAGGKTYILKILNDNASASRTSPAIKEVFRIQEEMPAAIRKAIRDFLTEKNISNSALLARTIYERGIRTKKWDLLPLTLEATTVSKAFALLENVSNVAEPAECAELRIRLGEAMRPYIQKLRSALSLEGLQTKEIEVVGSTFAEEARVRIDELVSQGVPEILSSEEISETLDLKSLAMTISSSPELCDTAAERLIYIICNFPTAYAKEKLTLAELETMLAGKNSPSIQRLKKFAILFSADDVTIMEAYTEASPQDKVLISNLVSEQDRRVIIDSIPEMAMQSADGSSALNDSFFNKIDAKTPHARSFIKQFFSGNKDMPCIEKIAIRKGLEALEAANDEDLIKAALQCTGPLTVLRSFALIKLVEAGRTEEALKILSTGWEKKRKAWHYAMIMMSFAKAKIEPEQMKFVHSALTTSPQTIERLGARDFALNLMRLCRIDLLGNPVPEASAIFSAPENPLPLAKALALLGDEQGMLILLRSCGKKVRGGYGKAVWYTISYLADCLRDMGSADKVDAIIKELNLEIDEEGETVKMIRKKAAAYFDTCIYSASVAPDGTVLTGLNGIYQGGNRAFACAKEDVLDAWSQEQGK